MRQFTISARTLKARLSRGSSNDCHVCKEAVTPGPVIETHGRRHQGVSIQAKPQAYSVLRHISCAAKVGFDILPEVQVSFAWPVNEFYPGVRK